MKKITKYITTSILLTCLAILTVTAQTVKRPDYSGTWLLDTAASKLNGVPLASAASTELSFAQHDTYIALAKLAKGPDGAPFYFKDTLTFDGRPSMKIVPNSAKYTKTTTMKLADDGKLVFSATYKLTGADGNEQTYASKELCSLSPDGKTLTLERSSILPDRTERITAVYHKK